MEPLGPPMFGAQTHQLLLLMQLMVFHLSSLKTHSELLRAGSLHMPGNLRTGTQQ